VEITYDLAEEAAIVTLGIETNGVLIPDRAVTRLFGDVCKLVDTGANSIIWNAGADWPKCAVTNARARVTAWSINAPPLYCAVDVAGGMTTNVYPVYYYVSAEAVPEGVTNDLYKTTRILMRRLSATGSGGFKMGSPDTEVGRRTAGDEDWHDVVLTKDYYIGVYEVTQCQWYQVMEKSRPSDWSNIDYWLTRPVENVSYDHIRGTAAQGGAGWPDNNNVHPHSFVGRLRTKAGLVGLDLPTDAQWEYACRSSTKGALNDGTVNLANQFEDDNLAELARYRANGGQIFYDSSWKSPEVALGVAKSEVTVDNATAKVGSYAPNTWGLYDMHGNVWEWCLDWFVQRLGTTIVINPVGGMSGTTSYRVTRGGSWENTALYSRSAFRNSAGASWATTYIGFRLARNLP
jgi:formylglycine-generating enzyme required for sulfatase activity